MFVFDHAIDHLLSVPVLKTTVDYSTNGDFLVLDSFS